MIRDPISELSTAAGQVVAALPLKQQLLEQIDRTRIVRLTKPEERFPSDLGILVGASDGDQRRNTLVARAL